MSDVLNQLDNDRRALGMAFAEFLVAPNRGKFKLFLLNAIDNYCDSQKELQKMSDNLKSVD